MTGVGYPASMAPESDRQAETSPGPPPRGLWFEDFTTGASFETGARTVTEADLVQFAGVSGDFTALHTDAESARRTPFRGRIAHGMLVQSIATGLAAQAGIFDGTIAALTSVLANFVAPVFPGDTVRLCLEVAGLDPEPSRRTGEVHFRAEVRNQKGVVVVQGEWRTRVLRRIKGSSGG